MLATLLSHEVWFLPVSLLSSWSPFFSSVKKGLFALCLQLGIFFYQGFTFSKCGESHFWFLYFSVWFTWWLNSPSLHLKSRTSGVSWNPCSFIRNSQTYLYVNYAEQYPAFSFFAKKTFVSVSILSPRAVCSRVCHSHIAGALKLCRHPYWLYLWAVLTPRRSTVLSRLWVGL